VEIKISIAVVLALALNGVGVAACDAGQNGNAPQSASQKNEPKVKPTPVMTGTPVRVEKRAMNDGMKVLAEGAYGNVSEAFIAVVRDAEGYAALRALAGNLPEVNADLFRTHAVVAAFLGTRTTGGYKVNITREANNALRISEAAPPQGAITTQALTAPFKIVSVPVNDGNSLVLQTGEVWQSASRPYNVKEGEFVSAGGIAGLKEQFRLEGNLHVARLGNLITISFALKSAERGKPRSLMTLATGITKDDGSFTIPRLDAGTLIDSPNGGLQAAGQLTDNGESFSLKFTPLPSRASDSFSGTGNLEAFAVAGMGPGVKKK